MEYYSETKKENSMGLGGEINKRKFLEVMKVPPNWIVTMFVQSWIY